MVDVSDGLKRAGLGVVVIGAGVIGSYTIPLLARSGRVRWLRIIDRDRYDDGNVESQWITAEDVGRPKAEVMAERVRAIDPALRVEAIVADVEHMPQSLVRGDVAMTCLDARRPRRFVSEAAWMSGVAVIDAGVGQPLLARVSSFIPGADSACYECGLSASHYESEASFRCDGVAVPPPSRTPAYLGAMAAAFQVTEFVRLAEGEVRSEGHEFLFDASTGRAQETRLLRSPSCRFHHRQFTFRQWEVGPQKAALGDVLSQGCHPARASSVEAPGQAFSLRVPGRLFVRRLHCSCGATREVLRLQGRLRPSDTRCGACGTSMLVMGAGLVDCLEGADLERALGQKTMSALGFQPGDVLTVGRGEVEEHYEFGLNP